MVRKNVPKKKFICITKAMAVYNDVKKTPFSIKLCVQIVKFTHTSIFSKLMETSGERNTTKSNMLQYKRISLKLK